MRNLKCRKAKYLTNQRLHSYCIDVVEAVEKNMQNNILRQSVSELENCMDEFEKALNLGGTKRFTEKIHEYGDAADLYYRVIVDTTSIMCIAGQRKAEAEEVMDCIRKRDVSKNKERGFTKRYADYVLTLKDIKRIDGNKLRLVGVDMYVNMMWEALGNYYKAREERSSHKVDVIGRTGDTRKALEESLIKVIDLVEALSVMESGNAGYENLCKVLEDKLYPYFETWKGKTEGEEDYPEVDPNTGDDEIQEAPSIEDTPFADESSVG